MRSEVPLRGPNYQETLDGFLWKIPQDYNIAVDVCDKHAKGRAKRALIYHEKENEYS